MTQTPINISLSGKDIPEKKTYRNRWNISEIVKRLLENQNTHWRKKTSEDSIIRSHQLGSRDSRVNDQRRIESLSDNVAKLFFKLRYIKNDLLQIFTIIL